MTIREQIAARQAERLARLSPEEIAASARMAARAGRVAELKTDPTQGRASLALAASTRGNRMARVRVPMLSLSSAARAEIVRRIVAGVHWMGK